MKEMNEMKWQVAGYISSFRVPLSTLFNTLEEAKDEFRRYKGGTVRLFGVEGTPENVGVECGVPSRSFPNEISPGKTVWF